MTIEAKTNDAADPELEMSSGLASVVEGELLSYQLCPVITIRGSMSRTSHLTTLKCRMLTSWLFYCHTMTCSDMWGHVEGRGDTKRHRETQRDTLTVRERERVRQTWGVRAEHCGLVRPRPALDQHGVHRQHSLWLLRRRWTSTASGQAGVKQE